MPKTTGKLAAISGTITSMSRFLISSRGLAQGNTSAPTDSDGEGTKDTITFDFGSLTNPFDGFFKSPNGTVKIQIVALVVNSELNVNLALLATSASFSYTNGANSFTAGPSSVNVRIVLPQISLIKTASAPIYTEAGSVVTYTLTISHGSSSTSPAFNLSVSDLLTSPYLKLNSGSVTISPAGNITTGNAVSDSTIYIIPPTISLTDVITVKYNATLTPPTIAGSDVPNTATVWYASAIATPENNNGNDVRYNQTTGYNKVLPPFLFLSSLPLTTPTLPLSLFFLPSRFFFLTLF